MSYSENHSLGVRRRSANRRVSAVINADQDVLSRLSRRCISNHLCDLPTVLLHEQLDTALSCCLSAQSCSLLEPNGAENKDQRSAEVGDVGAGRGKRLFLARVIIGRCDTMVALIGY